MATNSSYTEEEQRAAAYASFVHSAGRHLTATEAANLENDLAASPTDMLLRIKLLGYYKRQESREGKQRWIDHYQWFVSNQADKLLVTYFSRLPDKTSARQFQKLREEWLEAINSSPLESKVIGHAADFIGQRDYQLAEELYKRAQTLAPNDSTWPFKLCYLYVQQARDVCRNYRDEYAQLAFAHADRALKAFKSEDGIGIKVELLMRICDLAIECNNLNLARSYATRAIHLLIGSQIWLDRPYGRLGLIALREGDKDRAKKYFLKSAKYGFNTDTRLLHELQDLGETDSIIKYLKICKSGQDRNQTEGGQFDKWISAIKNGVTADFPVHEHR